MTREKLAARLDLDIHDVSHFGDMRYRYPGANEISHSNPYQETSVAVVYVSHIVRVVCFSFN
jgi:hypothetical protein